MIQVLILKRGEASKKEILIRSYNDNKNTTYQNLCDKGKAMGFITKNVSLRKKDLKEENSKLVFLPFTFNS